MADSPQEKHIAAGSSVTVRFVHNPRYTTLYVDNLVNPSYSRCLLPSDVMRVYVALCTLGLLLPWATATRGLNDSNPPEQDTNKKDLRIIAFGDSLTEGWIASTKSRAPWSPLVQTLLQQRLGIDWDVTVDNAGASSLTHV